jgi:hypothetical protein
MRSWIMLLFALVLTGAFVAQSGPGQAGSKKGKAGAGKAGSGKAGAPPSPIDDPVTPINNPDYYAWQLFAYVNAPAPMQTKVKVGGKDVMTNSALWETWASDDHTFGTKKDPPPDPKNPPKWPGPGQSRRLQLRPRALETRPISPHGKRILPRAAVENPEEEVFRNKPTFDFIIQNQLWYTQGLAAAFKKGQKGQPISFPTQSVEVKANWIKIPPDQRDKYHWNYDDSGDVYGLVAMHITSKVLPNWFWATFEWVDNPGRSDYIGSRDAFGVVYDGNTPSFQPPLLDDQGRQITGTVYPPGKVTDALKQLFLDFGYTKDWSGQWFNYRLKGSQTDFADSTGMPTLLGNSRTEAGFVPSASCITCHSRAAVAADGQDAFGAGFKDLLLPPIGVQIESYNGYPNPNWFWTKSVGGPALKNLQMDFVWAIPFRARAAQQ